MANYVQGEDNKISVKFKLMKRNLVFYSIVLREKKSAPDTRVNGNGNAGFEIYDKGISSLGEEL